VLQNYAQKYIDNFKKHKIPFICEQTALTKKIITADETFNFVQNSGLKNIELAFLNKVKKHVESNFDLRLIKNINASDVPFIQKYRAVKKNYWYSKELYEIDLSAAYWHAAKELGIIDEEIYLQGLNDKRISKKTRLISLGNLAKQKHISEFDGEKFINCRITPPPPTARCFFACAYHVAELMQRLTFIANDDYLFFWVDAIFFKNEKTKDYLVSLMSEANIKHKVIKLEKMIYKDDKIILQHIQNNKDKQRIFNFQKTTKLILE
jgi:hypothetical protein